jgi:hypothetical protein
VQPRRESPPIRLSVPEAESVRAPAAGTPRDAAPDVKTGLGPGAPVIGYVTVPALMNGTDVGMSTRAIERICERDGLRLVEIVCDDDRGPLVERSGMAGALERIARGEARGLVVSDTRLLGPPTDLAELLRRLQGARAALVAIDLGLDTSTSRGSRVATSLITMSGWGRRIATPLCDGVTPIGYARRPGGPHGVEALPRAVTPHNGRVPRDVTLEEITEQAETGT